MTDTTGVETQTPEEAIEAHNCVFHNLAMRDPAICAVDLALLGTLSGRAIEHRTCMVRGGDACRFHFLDEAGANRSGERGDTPADKKRSASE